MQHRGIAEDDFAIYQSLKIRYIAAVNQLSSIAAKPADRSGTGRRLVAIVLCLSAPTLLAAPASQSEYDLKAAFIAKFTDFIEWPEGSPVDDPNTPFTLCVIGDNPFGRSLDKLAELSRIKNKTVEVIASDKPTIPQRCDLAFISHERERVVSQILSEAQGKPILTIGDSPGLSQQGIMINFYPYKDSYRFEVNLDSAKANGFKLSARLLKLARITGQKP